MGLTVTSRVAQIHGARSVGRLIIVQWPVVLSAQLLQISPLRDQNVHHFIRIEQNAQDTSGFHSTFRNRGSSVWNYVIHAILMAPRIQGVAPTLL